MDQGRAGRWIAEANGVTIELEQTVHAHVTVYSFKVKNRVGSWPMAFGSVDQANAFLMGMFVWMRMSSRSWSFGLPKDVDAIEWQKAPE